MTPESVDTRLLLCGGCRQLAPIRRDDTLAPHGPDPARRRFCERSGTPAFPFSLEAAGPFVPGRPAVVARTAEAAEARAARGARDQGGGQAAPASAALATPPAAPRPPAGAETRRFPEPRGGFAGRPVRHGR